MNKQPKADKCETKYCRGTADINVCGVELCWICWELYCKGELQLPRPKEEMAVM